MAKKWGGQSLPSLPNSYRPALYVASIIIICCYHIIFRLGLGTGGDDHPVMPSRGHLGSDHESGGERVRKGRGWRGRGRDREREREREREI